MLRRFRRGVRRRSDGSFDVRLDERERELLETLSTQVRGLIEGAQDGEEANLRRLFPPTYGDDPAQDAAYQVMFGDELRQSRLAAIDRLCATARQDHIDEEEAVAWMQAINAVRLVLGTHLDIDEDPKPVSPRHPDAPMYYAYEYLGILLYDLVTAMSQQ